MYGFLLDHFPAGWSVLGEGAFDLAYKGQMSFILSIMTDRLPEATPMRCMTTLVYGFHISRLRPYTLATTVTWHLLVRGRGA